jgi:hypothetical protein
VLHRFFPGSIEECARVRREVEKQGWTVVFLLDDHPDDLPGGRKDGAAVSLEILRFCDGVICASECLAGLAPAGAIEVKVFEDRLIELPVMVPRDASKPYIYLTGIGKSGAGHPWVAELERVLLRNPCATLLMDDHRSLFEAINVGNKCFVDRSAVVSAESFAHCSIAILGGEAGDGAGALGRPFLRAAAYGMACVAAGSAFEGIVKHGVTGALVGGASGFGEALEILIREPVRCVAMARAARAWVSENRMFSQTISDQADWLKTLVSRQEASLSPVPPVNPA